MAIVLVEEVLGGLDEVKEALEQAVMMVEAITDDLHAALGPHLPAVLTHELVYPLHARLAFVNRLQDELAAVV
jgi:hypothetical protein